MPIGTLMQEYAVNMLYPIYLHKDEDIAYGLTFPDFEGCFSAADEMQDIQHMAHKRL
jgi:predicted RNase H-like HicB family nuclease